MTNRDAEPVEQSGPVRDKRAAAVSPWLEIAGERSPALEGEIDVDVAVIGAGYTGLSSALALRREGFSVAVLEAETAGWGASGRNAGHLTPTIGKDLPTLVKMYGRERVAALVALQERAIAYTEALIADHAIDCEYLSVGNVIAAVCEKQHPNLDRAAEAAREHGVPGELLEPDEMERRGLPRGFTRGYFEPHGGHLDPGRYVRGLRRLALEAGAQLYEDTPVTAVIDGPGPSVRTRSGVVRCRYVVIGTNGFTPQLPVPRLRRAGVRLQVQLFRTEPLTADQLDAVGWGGREGIYTAHEILESYRITDDNRIVGGSKSVRAGYGQSVLPDVDPGVSSFVEAAFRARFPELADVAVERHWGGPLFMSLDFLPVVGRTNRRGNIVHSVGYAGHGVAMASYAGEMVADLLLERNDGPGAALWSRRSISTPPEPLRSLAFHALVRFFAAIDRRADRTARGRRPPG